MKARIGEVFDTIMTVTMGDNKTTPALVKKGSSAADGVSAPRWEDTTSRFAHDASRRAAYIESEFAHARYIVVPSLLWAVAIVVLVVAAALHEERESAPAQLASPEQVPVVPLGV